MPVKNKSILEEYVATANSGKYGSWEEINAKFPELKGYKPEVLEEYVATANSGKYNSWDEINNLFPEFSSPQTAQPKSFTQELPKPTMPSGGKLPQGVGAGVKAPAKTKVENIDDFNKKYKTNYTVKQLAGKEPIPQEIKPEAEGLATELYESLKRGSSMLGSYLARTPAFMYDVAAYPQNKLAEITGLPIGTSSQEIAETLNLPENEVAKFYEQAVEQSNQKLSQKYDKSIDEYLFGDKPDYVKGFKLLANRITESAPMSISMMLGNAAGIGATASTIGGGFVFGAGEKQSLEGTDLSETEKVENAFSKGLFEGIFEQFGVTSLGNVIKDIALKEGKDQAIQMAKKGFMETFGPTAKKYLGIASEESLSEAATQYAQNWVSILSGEKPDLDPMDGVVEAGIIGLGSGVAFSTPTAAADIMSLSKNKKKANELTQKQNKIQELIESPDVSPETKEVLSAQSKQINEQITDIYNEGKSVYEQLDDEQKATISENNAEVAKIEAAISDPNIDESIKADLEQTLNDKKELAEEYIIDVLESLKIKEEEVTPQKVEPNEKDSKKDDEEPLSEGVSGIWNEGKSGKESAELYANKEEVSTQSTDEKYLDKNLKDKKLNKIGAEQVKESLQGIIGKDVLPETNKNILDLQGKLKKVELERTNFLISGNKSISVDEKLKNEISSLKSDIKKESEKLAEIRKSNLEKMIDNGQLKSAIDNNLITAEDARLEAIGNGVKVPNWLQDIVDKNKLEKESSTESIFDRTTDFLGEEKEAFMIPKTDKSVVRNQEDIDYFKSNVKRAIDNGKFEQAVKDGRMTLKDAKVIAESYGLKLPKSLLKTNEPTISESDTPKGDTRVEVTEPTIQESEGQVEVEKQAAKEQTKETPKPLEIKEEAPTKEQGVEIKEQENPELVKAVEELLGTESTRTEDLSKKEPKIDTKAEKAVEEGDKVELELYHGSPHSFGKFDINKLGSGEGAQAFGWGLYFTNDPSIAKGYANVLGSKKNFWESLLQGNEISLSKSDYDFISKELDSLGFDGSRAENEDLGNIIVDGKTEYNPSVLDAMSILFGKKAKEELEGYDLSPEQIDRLFEIKKKISNPQFYKVSINKDKTNFLEWAADVKDQQLKQIGEDFKKPITGKELYESLSKKLGGDKQSSLFLLSKGIDGIIYKSKKGTGGEKGTGRNYVIFDSKTINVKEINEKPITEQAVEELTPAEQEKTENKVEPTAEKTLDAKNEPNKVVEKTLEEEKPKKTAKQEVIEESSSPTKSPKKQVRKKVVEMVESKTPSKTITEWKKESLDLIDKAINILLDNYSKDKDVRDRVIEQLIPLSNLIDDDSVKLLTDAGLKVENGKLIIPTPKGQINASLGGLLTTRKETSKLTDSKVVSNENTRIKNKQVAKADASDFYEPESKEDAKDELDVSTTVLENAKKSGDKKLIELAKIQYDFYKDWFDNFDLKQRVKLEEIARQERTQAAIKKKEFIEGSKELKNLYNDSYELAREAGIYEIEEFYDFLQAINIKEIPSKLTNEIAENLFAKAAIDSGAQTFLTYQTRIKDRKQDVPKITARSSWKMQQKARQIESINKNIDRMLDLSVKYESGATKIFKELYQKESGTDRVVMFLDSLKIRAKGKALGVLPPFAIPLAVWNTAIDTIILAYKGGKLLNEAIQDGIEYLESQKVKADLEEVRKYFNEKLGVKEEKPTEETPTQAPEPPKQGPKLKQSGFQVRSLMGGPDEISAQIAKDNPVLYERMNLKDEYEEAKGVIKSYQDVLDNDDLINENAPKGKKTQALRLMAMQQVSLKISELVQAGKDASKATNLYVRIMQATAKDATESGQENAILALWKFSTPEGIISSFMSKIEEVNKNSLELLTDAEKQMANEMIEGLKEKVAELEKQLAEQIVKTAKRASTNKAKEANKPSIVKDIEGGKITDSNRKAVSDFFDKFLIKTDGGQTFAVPLPPQIWNGFVLGVKNLVLGGMKLNDALRKASAELIRNKQATPKETVAASKELYKLFTEQEMRESSIRKTLRSLVNDEKLSVEDAINMLSDKKSKDMLEATLSKDALKKARTLLKNGEISIDEAMDMVLNQESKDALQELNAEEILKEVRLLVKQGKITMKEAMDMLLDQKSKEALQESMGELFTKVYGTSKIPLTQPKSKKTDLDKIIEGAVQGALNDNFYKALFLEKFGLMANLNSEQINKLNELATAVFKLQPATRTYNLAVFNMIRYMKELYPTNKFRQLLDTWFALNYGNMLSGPTTTAINLYSTGSNVFLQSFKTLGNYALWARAINKGIKDKDLQTFKSYSPLVDLAVRWRASYNSLGRGLDQFISTLRGQGFNTKYVEDISRFTGEPQISELERAKYGDNRFIGGKANPANWLKYVIRFLVAQDAFAYNTVYEASISNLLLDEYRNKGLKGKELLRAVQESVLKQKVNFPAIQEQVLKEVKILRKAGVKVTRKEIRTRISEVAVDLILKDLNVKAEQVQEVKDLAASSTFTDNRYGLTSKMSEILGQAANKTLIGKLLLKPFIPFVKIPTNVIETMLDSNPYYGVLRAQGYSISGLASKVSKKLKLGEFQTAQMGEIGSKKYYEQMGRAFLGINAFVLMAMISGDDDDDFVQLTGGLAKERKEGAYDATKVKNPYVLKIGKFELPFLNIPALAIPLGLLGNYNDYMRLHKNDSEGAANRLFLAMWYANSETLFMVKDLSFLQGIQTITEAINKIFTQGESKLDVIFKTLYAQYGGFLARPLPQNNNLILQIEQFFDDKSYSKKTVEDITYYILGLQRILGKPSVDILGEDVKRLPGEQFILYDKWFRDEVVRPELSFLFKYNAMQPRLKNSETKIFNPETGEFESRIMTRDEFYDYNKLAGKKFAQKIGEYMLKTTKDGMSYAEKRASEVEKIQDKDKKHTELTGLQKDMNDLHSEAQQEAKRELFIDNLMTPEELATLKKFEEVEKEAKLINKEAEEEVQEEIKKAINPTKEEQQFGNSLKNAPNATARVALFLNRTKGLNEKDFDNLLGKMLDLGYITNSEFGDIITAKKF